MRRYHPTVLCSIIVIFALLITACPSSSNFARNLRLVLSASGPLIESLPLSSTLKTGLITDFTDMAGDAANLGDCLNGAADKPTKLTCIQTFSGEVENIIARGHFGEANNPRLQQILGLLRGIISSAKIYYGQPSARASSKPVTEETIKAQIKGLETAMQP